MTPDSIQSLHAETIRLKRLIDDLYQLSLSDIGALAYRTITFHPVEHNEAGSSL